MKNCTVFFVLLCCVSFLNGCGRLLLSDKEIDTYSKMHYPRTVALPVEDLDIVATQSRTELTLNNRSAHAFRHVDLWINQEYVTRVDEIKIGESSTNVIELGVFINKHSESYPVGGFLTPDRAFPVIIVELFDPATGKKYRLLSR